MGEAVDGRKGHLSHVFDREGVRADDGRQRGQAEADGHGHADGAQHDEITEQRGQRFDVVTENDRRSDDENRYEPIRVSTNPQTLTCL